MNVTVALAKEAVPASMESMDTHADVPLEDQESTASAVSMISHLTQISNSRLGCYKE